MKITRREKVRLNNCKKEILYLIVIGISCLSLCGIFIPDSGLICTVLKDVSKNLYGDNAFITIGLYMIYAIYLYSNIKDEAIEIRVGSIIIMAMALQGSLYMYDVDSGKLGSIVGSVILFAFRKYIGTVFLILIFSYAFLRILNIAIFELKDFIWEGLIINYNIHGRFNNEKISEKSFVECTDSAETFTLLPLPKIVPFKSITNTKEFLTGDKMLVPFGTDENGTNIYHSITDMPHALIAGVTKSGKSVFVSNLICSLILKNSPDDLKFVMVDLKLVELSIYKNIKHLMCPIVTDESEVEPALVNLNRILKDRLNLFSENGCRDYDEFTRNGNKIPRIVLIIDEFADLSDETVFGKKAVNNIIGLVNIFARKSRAAGIHLIVAMQRPTTDIIKGSVKTNIPVRIAFACTDATASRVILESNGAEQITERGEALYKTIDQRSPKRIKAPLITTTEVGEIVLKNQSENSDGYVVLERSPDKKIFELKKPMEKKLFKDILTEDIILNAIENGSISIRSIRKEYSIGDNRAHKILAEIERIDGIISTEKTDFGAREMLLRSIDEWEVLKRNLLNKNLESAG